MPSVDSVRRNSLPNSSRRELGFLARVVDCSDRTPSSNSNLLRLVPELDVRLPIFLKFAHEHSPSL